MDPHSNNGQSNVSKPKKPKPSPPPPPISASEILAEFSHHDPFVARINNGSFGSCPSSVLAAQSTWQLLFLRQPDHFYFNLLHPSILRSRSLLKSLINADDVSELSLVDNATTAAAIVLQHVQRSFADNTFSKGDAVVMLHYAFSAVKKSISAYVARAGGHVVEVSLPFPVESNQEIITEFTKALDSSALRRRKVRLAVIDHVTSMPSVVIPVKELVAICREKGVDRVFVDAAHAIGNIDVDVKDIGADFYASNLHKWFFCPPSVAFLYSKKSPTSWDLHHPVVSELYGNGLAVESGWVGNRDYSAQLVMPAVLDFVSRFEGGIDGIRKRNHQKVVEMGRMLAEAWETCLGSPPEMCCSMVMVGLPGCLGIENEEDASKLRTHLRDKFKIEVPIYYNSLTTGCGEVRNGRSLVTGYARISHQVYNVESDYYRLRDAINDLVQNGVDCRKLSST